MGFGDKAISYSEALVLKLSVHNENYDEISAMSNMPLLFIDKYSYHYIRKENREKIAEFLSFTLLTGEDLTDGMPMTYTLNHYNPHDGSGQVKFNSKLIEK